MKQLLKLECRKLFKRKSFYICGAIMLVLLFLSMLTTNALMDLSPELGTLLAVNGVDSMLSSLDSASFVLIISIVTVLAVSDDFDQNTIKNVYAKGYSRIGVYFSKMISAWFGATLLFVAVMLLAFLLGSAFFGVGTISAKAFGLIGGQFWVMLANVTIFASIALMLRKVGGSIAICIVGTTFIGVILALIDVFIQIDGFTLSDYWIDGFLVSLTSLSVDGERIAVCLIGATIYLILFFLLGMFVHKKRDV